MRVKREPELVVRAVGGDRAAFDALAERCRPWLFGLCLRLVADRHAAEDLVQEALVQAMRGMAELRDAERFRAWLSRIAVNACRMHLRRAASAAPHSAAPEHLELPAQTSPEPPLGVDDALDRLDPGQRRILMLFYAEGLSHAELGEALALSPAAVKSRLHRARERLRREMLKMMSPEQKARLGLPKEAPWSLRTILLVEPDEAVRESLREGLTAAGYEAVLLPTGEAALSAAEEHKGQMLILDKHCGEPNWVEVLTLLQVDAWSRDNLPIGVLIDRDDPPHQRDLLLAWQAGAVFCLSRPPSTEEVVKYVRDVEKQWAEGWRVKSDERAAFPQ
jgi:RNA polymerase sigma-70 factor (ECF subfamily)